MRQPDNEFDVTISENLVTAVHRYHRHKYFFPRTADSTRLGPPTWQENSSAKRGPEDYVDSAHEAARIELRRVGILEGGGI
jgi:hypothetical protein